MSSVYFEVMKFMNDHLTPDVTAKKARGEVFTPPGLVGEMLFGLSKKALEEGKLVTYWENEDEDDRVGGIPTEVWRNPNTKWIDPANGIGNFPIVAFYRLDYQLAKVPGFDNADIRRKHIIEKMLFMIELDAANIVVCRQLFSKIQPDAKPNICCADSLQMTDECLEASFGISRFDVVMGNPPFNTGGTKHHGDRGYYRKFTNYGFSIMRTNGYLVFIHPPNYHRIDKDSIRDLFNENNLLFLRIIPKTKTYFNVQISLDYYVLQKSKNTGSTTLLDWTNELCYNIDVSKYKVVPNFGYHIIQKLMNLKDIYGGFAAQPGRDSNKHQSREKFYIGKQNTFKIIHTMIGTGLRIFMSNEKHTHQDKKKIVINGMGVPYIFYDKNGEYGVTQAPNYVLEPSEKEIVFLQSKLFQYLLWAYRIQGNKNDNYVFDVLPNVNTLPYSNQDELYAALGLDKLEFEKYTVPHTNETNIVQMPSCDKN